MINKTIPVGRYDGKGTVCKQKNNHVNKSTTKYYHYKTKLMPHCGGLKETIKMLVNNNISDRKD